jgi:serine protease AprX
LAAPGLSWVVSAVVRLCGTAAGTTTSRFRDTDDSLMIRFQLARPFSNRPRRSSDRVFRGDARRRDRFGAGTRPPAVTADALHGPSGGLGAIAVPSCRSAVAALAVALLTVLCCALAAPTARAEGRQATEVIVQFERGTSRDAEVRVVRAAGGRVVRDLHLIRGLGVRLPAGAAARLARARGVRAVTANAAMSPTAAPAAPPGRYAAWDPAALATAFNQSTRTDRVWTSPRTSASGDGVTVAVVDTGIAGGLPDFATSSTDPTSRVIASAVVNPDATTADDLYGHGTHVAGLVAGNTRALATTDPLNGRYMGTAPNANLVSIKASDDHGRSSLIDVIAGLQFAVDHKADLRIRVVNLSLTSMQALSYRVDPLDAAVEAAWFHGLVVVAAAGNRGTDADAVSYAPGNDPYAITVGAVDDHGTKDTLDDTLAPWSSRGVTQDGFAKPDIVAPGAHIASTLAPGSDFASLCPDCVVDGRYFRLGGTSMAAPIVAGIAADVIAVHPDWSPNQVKGALTYLSGRSGTSNVRQTADGAWEVAADLAATSPVSVAVANQGLVPSDLVDSKTGDIDWVRASWGRASWGAASGPLRASWGRASWGAFFGETPQDYGELRGGDTGKVRPSPAASATGAANAAPNAAGAPAAAASANAATSAAPASAASAQAAAGTAATPSGP